MPLASEINLQSGCEPQKECFMKRSVLIFVLALAVFFSGCGEGNSLSGVWIGKLYDSDIVLAFVDDLCFLILDQSGMEYSSYTFLKDEGILVTDLGNMPIELKGNSLTLTYYGIPIIFIKDTTTAKAPITISGVWKGPTPWVFAFVNERVFIVDRDKDPDYANYTFTGNEGSFETKRYGWEMSFTVRGNTLTTSNELEATFTRTK